MRRLRLVAAALVFLGCVGAHVWFRTEPRPIEQRLGFRVLRADFHVHTRLSDGFLSPLEVPSVAARRGLDVVAVTEHNLLFPSHLARWANAWAGSPVIVLGGEEITTAAYHVIAVGLSRGIDASASLQTSLRNVHEQGGIAIAAHPVRRFARAFEAVEGDLDGAEVMHPLAYAARRLPEWDWRDMPRFFLAARARGHRLTAVGSSDYHGFDTLGSARTFVFVRDATEKGVVDALRMGRTVVFDLEGTAYGDPALVASLAERPLRRRSVESYTWSSLADRATALMGLVGVWALLCLSNPAGGVSTRRVKRPREPIEA